MNQQDQLDLSIALRAFPAAAVGQLLYAMHFCDPRIQRFEIKEGTLHIRAVRDDAPGGEPTEAAISRKASRLVARYAQPGLAVDEQPLSRTSHRREVAADVTDDLVKQGVLVQMGPGRMVLRGRLAQLAAAVDREALRRVAAPMKAVPEVYPVTVGAADLAKTQHLSSFPEHLHFVTHLAGDLDLIDRVGQQARDGGPWDATAATVAASSEPPSLVINPSVCYQCYIARAGMDLGTAGVCVTARSRCHRWEGGAMAGLRRLCDFDMREVIFLGHPEWVQERRGEAERILIAWAEEWGLDAQLVNANDPFFTDDFEVKAAFQRRQDAKHELTVPMPDGKPMAVSSSNFHSVTFGKAFGIRRGGPPACSGCVGFGLERWAYTVVLQHGADPARWPPGIRAACEAT